MFLCMYCEWSEWLLILKQNVSRMEPLTTKKSFFGGMVDFVVLSVVVVIVSVVVVVSFLGCDTTGLSRKSLARHEN